ncbi:MAG TPA: aminotransferase class V-fold PLP-dependent enzyme [Verrucomicrobiae bacterium]|nr:aminotransferase class V-fold PLP-dependent enzyme [Verrucomicrobiae bacterium]
MTLADLQSNEELRQFEFPVTRDKIYLGHAGVSPLPRRVHEAINRYTTGSTLNDQEFVLHSTWLRETRQFAANFIGAKTEEIAFIGPTSLALSFIAEGLIFRKNHNLLVYHDDYPSNVYPWMTLAGRGVEVRFLNVREYGCIRPRDIVGQVDENTRLVALASCHFLASYRIDLDEIGQALRSRGILFCVDAIQTLGAFPTRVTSVDFLASDAHKWLLGPCAAGLMFVRQEVQSQLRPVTHGWHNINSPNYVTQDDLSYKPDARRYEAGSHNLLGIVGLRAALELLDEIGMEEIGRDLLRKRSWFVPALEEKGYTVLNASASVANCGGMVTFYKAGASMAEIHSSLEQNKIFTSLRADRKKQSYIRLAPHFYNTDSELKSVLEHL